MLLSLPAGAPLAAVCAVTAIVSFLACAALVRLAPRLGLQAEPNARSSHSRPTAQGGGVGFVLASLVGLGVLAGSGWRTAASPATLATVPGLLTDPWLLGAALLLAVTGFVDDRRGLARRARLAVQALAVLVLLARCVAAATLPEAGAPLAAGSAALAGSGPAALPWSDSAALPWPAVAVLLGLAGVAGLWWLNLFNFMDGIDALAASEFVFLVVAGLQLAGRPDASLCVCVAAVLGFVPWNLPKARLFMGDAGSLFLGFIVLTLAGGTLAARQLHVTTLLVLSAAFVADATVTLIRRMMSGQRFADPHRSHAYQRLSRRFGSHGRATALYLAIDVAVLWPVAAFVQSRPAHDVAGVAAAALTLAALAAGALAAGGGRAETAVHAPVPSR